MHVVEAGGKGWGNPVSGMKVGSMPVRRLIINVIKKNFRLKLLEFKSRLYF